MSVQDKIDFTNVEGDSTGHSITVYALSTCGFCRRAISYLRDRKLAFRYVNIDQLEPEIKAELRAELRERHQRSLIFPFLVVDGDKSTTGFVKEKWDELLA
mgnify:CR=1 FL=1